MSCSDLIYFDQAATTYPKPPTVWQALQTALSACGGNPGRSAHRLSLSAAEGVYEVREAICRFFEASSPECVIFTKNATEALNLAIFSVLAEGGHALCSDMEHNAVFRPLSFLQDSGKITFDIFETHPFSEERLRSLLKKDTKAVFVTHASNVCGRVLPIARIGAFCRENGLIFVVDASQSAGHIPISLVKDGIDILCAPAHKGLFGILGAGFVLLETGKVFPPFLHGGSGVNSLSPQMPQALPERYEAGSLPVPAILALGASLQELERGSTEERMAHIHALEAYLKEELSRRADIRLIAPEENGSGIISFLHDRLSPSALAARLDEENVAVRAGYHCAPLAHRTLGTMAEGTVRIGLSFVNTQKEAEDFCARLRKVCAD